MASAVPSTSTVAVDAIREAFDADLVLLLAAGASGGRWLVMARSGTAAGFLPDEIVAPPGSSLADAVTGTCSGVLAALPFASGGTSGRSGRLGPSMVARVAHPNIRGAVLVVSRRASDRAYDDEALERLRGVAAGWTEPVAPTVDLSAMGGDATFRRTLEPTGAGMSLVDSRLRYWWVNAPLCTMLGRGGREMLGLAVTETVHPQHVDRVVAFYDRLRGGAARERLMFRRPDGQPVWSEIGGSMVSSATQPAMYLVQQFDVTAEQEEADQLAYRAMHDDLTGLANRTLLRDRLQAVLARSCRDGSRAVAFYLDVDRFKEVNDQYGHAAGDAVLVRTAERLTAVVRAGDTVARVGGDEFVVAGHATGAGEAALMADRIADALAPPIDFGEAGALQVAVSVGVALNGPLDTPSDLIDRADRALLRAKRLRVPHVVSAETL